MVVTGDDPEVKEERRGGGREVSGTKIRMTLVRMLHTLAC